MATIKLDGLRKNFGKTEVIHGIDINIEDGEFIVIVGPSGCGKSTMLRMVAGLETVTSGEVQINGVQVNELEPMDRNIAMVFQNYALYPHMNVFDNMAYGLKIAKTPKPEIAERVRAAAKLLQLEDCASRYSRTARGASSGVIADMSQSALGVEFCLFASASIKLASAANRWPLTKPSAMHRATVVSNRWRSRSLSRNRPCLFLEKVEWSGTRSVKSRRQNQRYARFRWTSSQRRRSERMPRQ